MDEFKDSIRIVLQQLGVDEITIMKLADHLREPEDETKLDECFDAVYLEWKKKEGFPVPKVPIIGTYILNAKLSEQLEYLNDLFFEYDDQPGSPLASD